MALAHDVEWVPLYGIGRVVNHLQRHGMTYAEISKQTGIASYLLKKAKQAYSDGDRTTVTAKSRVKGIERASTTERRPTSVTLVSRSMCRSACLEIEKLLDGGMTIAHITRITGLDDQTIATAGKHSMTWETYQRIMLAMPDLKGDLDDGFGTHKAAKRRTRKKTAITKRAKRQPRLRAVIGYLDEHPDAQIEDVARDLDMKVTALRRLRNCEPKLAKRLPSRLDRSRERKATVSKMLDENPELRCIEVQKALGIPKTTAHSLLTRVRKERETEAKRQTEPTKERGSGNNGSIPHR